MSLHLDEPDIASQEKRLMPVPVTVIMPAYNEEGSIHKAVKEVEEYVLDQVSNSQLLVINDGSKDQTGQILDQLAQEDTRVAVIHQANGGHGSALMTGLDAASSEYVFLIDSDCQIPLQSFLALWQSAQTHDGAFGVRQHRQDTQVRLWLTWSVRQLLKVLFKVKLHDGNVPYKIVRRAVWQEARKTIPLGTLTPSLFLAIFMARRGYQFAEIPVTHKDRESGTVSIRHWKLLKFCWKAFGQALEFRRALGRKPL